MRTENGHSGWGLTLSSTNIIVPAIVSQSLPNNLTTKSYQLSLWAMYNPPANLNASEPSQRLLTAGFGEVGKHCNITAPVGSWQSFTFEMRLYNRDDSLTFTAYDLGGGSFVLDDVSLLDSS